MMEYIIVADYDICGKTSTCMVCIGGTEERAKEVLASIRAGDPAYKHHLGKGINPRIESVAEKDQWWHQGGLD